MATHLIHDDHPLHAGVLGDHAQGLVQGSPKNAHTYPLITGEGLL